MPDRYTVALDGKTRQEGNQQASINDGAAPGPVEQGRPAGQCQRQAAAEHNHRHMVGQPAQQEMAITMHGLAHIIAVGTEGADGADRGPDGGVTENGRYNCAEKRCTGQGQWRIGCLNALNISGLNAITVVKKLSSQYSGAPSLKAVAIEQRKGSVASYPIQHKHQLPIEPSFLTTSQPMQQHRPV